MRVTDPASLPPAAPDARLLRPSATAALAPPPIDASSMDSASISPEVRPSVDGSPLDPHDAPDPPAQLVALVCDRVAAENSKLRYARAIRDFWCWYQSLPAPRPPIAKALILAYRAARAARGLAPRTLNVELAVLRALAEEAADAGWLAPDQAAAICRIRDVPVRGTRLGRWLSEAQTHAFVAAPDASTPLGLRDRAAIALLFNAGLRRTELTSLDVPHLRRVDVVDEHGHPGQRWILADVLGKGGRIRSVPIQEVVAGWVQEWLTAAGIADGPLFRGFYKDARSLRPNRLSGQAVHDIVTRYGKALGLDVSPHAIRRTMGQIAEQRGGDLRQIQLIYGHASLATTERYLRVDLQLVNAVTDRVTLVPASVDPPPR